MKITEVVAMVGDALDLSVEMETLDLERSNSRHKQGVRLEIRECRTVCRDVAEALVGQPALFHVEAHGGSIAECADAALASLDKWICELGSVRDAAVRMQVMLTKERAK